MKKNFLIVLLFMVLVSAHAQSKTAANQSVPSPYEPDILFSFANSLYDEGFLNQAESEYKRFLFALTPDSLNSNLKVQTSLTALTNIYKKQNSVNGIEWLKKNFYSNAQTPVKEKINFVQADFIFKERNAQAFDLFCSSIAFEKPIFTSEFNNLIDASSLLLNNNIDELKELCSYVAGTNPDYEKLNELCKSYKLKSPGLALFLSSVIPGCGKWYTGSFGAFVSSFLSIGSFAAGTVVSGIQTNWKSWQPYVFGACGAVLYITELYGAYQSAKRYNAALYRVLCEETEKIYEKEY